MADLRPRILVVEDDPHFAEFLHHLLERQDFRVDCAAAAAPALRLLEGEDIDLVITDVVMPDMDGIEFLRSFPIQARGLPVIAITGSPLNAGGTLSRVMHALGAARVLAKPFAAAELMAAIHAVLQQSPREYPSLNQTA